MQLDQSCIGTCGCMVADHTEFLLFSALTVNIHVNGSMDTLCDHDGNTSIRAVIRHGLAHGEIFGTVSLRIFNREVTQPCPVE